MCGFAGYLSFGPTGQLLQERRRVLQAMGDAIAHRGPDDAQYLEDGALSLVFRRLAVVDPRLGRQPIANETRDVFIAANAEIYNHAALRSELQSRHGFATHSDCEAPLHAYEEWGDSMLQRLTGMFAMALWDRRQQRLLLARDRLGIKPLYVCRVEGSLLFASELKALLAHPHCPRELDWRALDFTAGAQAPETTYVRGVRQLPGGTMLTATVDGAVAERSYWQIDDHFATAPFGDDARAYTERYADLLEQATHEHLQRDAQAGMLLSGGVDSSLLAAIVAGREKDLPCFTLVERTPLLGGDVDSARRLAHSLGLPWHPVLADYRHVAHHMDYGLERFEQDVWMIDSPRFDLDWIFKSELHRVARATFPGLKVMLLGQGADEFAGGYSTRLDAPYGTWHEYLQQEVGPNILHAQAQRDGGADRLWSLRRNPNAGSDGVGPYHQMMSLFVRQLQHHNLWHEDRTSAWHSLESRVPFLDHRLVELLASVPAQLHPRLFWRKTIVRDALRRFAPSHELLQPKIAFIESADRSSHDLIGRSLLMRCYDDFRDGYLSEGTPFDRAKIDALADRVWRCGPTLSHDVMLLAQSMAIAVFERQCRVGAPGRIDTNDARVPVLPSVPASGWQALLDGMQADPVLQSQWHINEHVRLRDGVQILVPARHGVDDSIWVCAGGVLAGELRIVAGHDWLASFLRNLGSGATTEFTVGDWIDEFDLQQPAMFAVLDMLRFRGVIEPAQGERAATRARDESSHASQSGAADSEAAGLVANMT